MTDWRTPHRFTGKDAWLLASAVVSGLLTGLVVVAAGRAVWRFMVGG